MDFSCVHPDEVMKIIGQLSNSTAFGLDNIDTYIIKLIKEEITPALTHIINLSLRHNTYPEKWKSSKVVPLYKKDDPLNPKNYRPVALIPVLSKVLERVVSQQIIQYLSKNNILNPNHHAYRSKHNTSTAMIQMVNSWAEALESGEMAGVCLLDMSAAFDIVNHDILLQKMTLYGFEENIISWLRSYLTNRKQCVSINGSLSKLLPLSSGVPQGSILGPLLYSIFTNDLPEVIEKDRNQSICCYADDTTHTSTNRDHTALSKLLSENYTKISDYMRENQLKLNDDKTHLVVISTQNSSKKTLEADLVRIVTPTKIIAPSSSEKLLGCWIQSNLKWTEYMRDSENNLFKSLTKRISAIQLISKYSDFKTRKMLADGIFMSKLIYLTCAWSSCPRTYFYTFRLFKIKQLGW